MSVFLFCGAVFHELYFSVATFAENVSLAMNVFFSASYDNVFSFEMRVFLVHAKQS